MVLNKCPDILEMIHWEEVSDKLQYLERKRLFYLASRNLIMVERSCEVVNL